MKWLASEQPQSVMDAALGNTEPKTAPDKIAARKVKELLARYEMLIRTEKQDRRILDDIFHHRPAAVIAARERQHLRNLRNNSPIWSDRVPDLETRLGVARATIKKQNVKRVDKDWSEFPGTGGAYDSLLAWFRSARQCEAKQLLPADAPSKVHAEVMPVMHDIHRNEKGRECGGQNVRGGACDTYRDRHRV